MDFFEKLDTDYKKLVQYGAEQLLIGKTMANNPIYAFCIGCGYPKIIAQYAIHAREFITYDLAILHATKLLKSLPFGAGTIYIIPIVNVDGVAICKNGADAIKEFADNLIEINKSNDFGMWKANARGVDLNVNFPALWGTGKRNKRRAGAENYIGQCPASESETRALMEFTDRVKPDLTLSFHSKGEVIFYDFYQNKKQKRRDKKIAEVVSKSTKYPIKPTGKSAGGYKDWCITKGITALTIEVGKDTWAHPIRYDKLPLIWADTRNIFDDLLKFFHNQKR